MQFAKYKRKERLHNCKVKKRKRLLEGNPDIFKFLIVNS